MKNLSFFLLLASALGTIHAQAPDGYYDGTENLTGYSLKTKLSQIINNGTEDHGYGGLWNAYKTGDLDKYYEKDNTILDIYSEIPTGTDAYEYTPGTDQCGSAGYTKEGDCYNREHLFPQSFFYEKAPMKGDYNFIFPTDGKVNNIRDNYPFGTVGTVSGTPSTNGSKLGTSNFPGYGGTVFEPIDEFKGDIARSLLYFITRYEDKLPDFKYSDNNNPQDGSKDRGFEQWYINLLLKWNHDDPVSQKEIDRNNYAYTYQKNRNPFIDHPEFVDKIWTSTLSSDEIKTIDKRFIIQNPVQNGTLVIAGKYIKDIQNVQIFDMSGRIIQQAKEPFRNTNTLRLKNLSKGNYILKADQQSVKFIIE